MGCKEAEVMCHWKHANVGEVFDSWADDRSSWWIFMSQKVWQELYTALAGTPITNSDTLTEGGCLSQNS